MHMRSVKIRFWAKFSDFWPLFPYFGLRLRLWRFLCLNPYQLKPLIHQEFLMSTAFAHGRFLTNCYAKVKQE